MTLFLDLRTADVGGAPAAPRLLEGDGVGHLDQLRLIQPFAVKARLSGRNLLFAAHGFNVSRPYGAFSLGSLDAYLGLAGSDALVAVLWPGDAWLTVVDYPFEGAVSLQCGRLVAEFCNTCCVAAQSLSFLSHSLGARVVLEAIMHLDRSVRSVCLTAAAINRDCLTKEYALVASVAERISILASAKDHVLRLAYGIGDPFADLLDSDHTLFTAALGYKGPPLPTSPPLAQPWQIPDSPAYDHGDYLPKMPRSATEEWQRPAEFMRRAFLGLAQAWPP